MDEQKIVNPATSSASSSAFAVPTSVAPSSPTFKSRAPVPRFQSGLPRGFAPDPSAAAAIVIDELVTPRTAMRRVQVPVSAQAQVPMSVPHGYIPVMMPTDARPSGSPMVFVPPMVSGSKPHEQVGYSHMISPDGSSYPMPVVTAFSGGFQQGGLPIVAYPGPVFLSQQPSVMPSAMNPVMQSQKAMFMGIPSSGVMSPQPKVSPPTTSPMSSTGCNGFAFQCTNCKSFLSKDSISSHICRSAALNTPQFMSIHPAGAFVATPSPTPSYTASPVPSAFVPSPGPTGSPAPMKAVMMAASPVPSSATGSPAPASTFMPSFCSTNFIPSSGAGSSFMASSVQVATPLPSQNGTHLIGTPSPAPSFLTSPSPALSIEATAGLLPAFLRGDPKLLSGMKTPQSYSSETPGHSPLPLGIQVPSPHPNVSNLSSPSAKASATPRQASWQCSFCEKAFTSRSNLLSHTRTHTGEKPFGCEVCGSRFVKKSNLTRHMLIHSGDKPFECKDCGKRFRQRRNLVRHRSTHSEEKPFVCNVCGWRFRRKSNLLTHGFIHTGEKPFLCKICGKSFRQKGSLSSHLQTHADAKLFQCEICGEKLSRKSSLKRHMQSFHASTTQETTITDSTMLSQSDIKPTVPSDTGNSISSIQSELGGISSEEEDEEELELAEIEMEESDTAEDTDQLSSMKDLEILSQTDSSRKRKASEVSSQSSLEESVSKKFKRISDMEIESIGLSSDSNRTPSLTTSFPTSSTPPASSSE